MGWLQTFLVTLGLSITLTARATAQADLPTAQRFVLANGLRLVVLEDHRLPQAVVGISFSAPDPTGSELEALLRAPADEQARALREQLLTAGAAHGWIRDGVVSTWMHRLPRSSLHTALEYAATQLGGPRWSAAEWPAWRGRLRIRTTPAASQLLRFERLAMQTAATPRLQPTGTGVQPGWLERATVDEARAFVQRHVTAGGVVLTVVGDVVPSAVEQECARAFAGLQAGPAARLVPRAASMSATAQTSRRWTSLRGEIGGPARLAYGWRVPAAAPQQSAVRQQSAARKQSAKPQQSAAQRRSVALGLLATELGRANGPLASALRAAGVVSLDVRVTSARAGAQSLVLLMDLGAGVDVAQLVATIDRQLYTLAARGLGASDLQRVRRREHLQRLLMQSDPQRLAAGLGAAELSAGDANAALAAAPGLTRVTSTDLTRLVSRWLSPQRANVVEVLPAVTPPVGGDGEAAGPDPAPGDASSE